MTDILTVRDLTVSYDSSGARLRALNDVGFSIAPGQALGIVGESGSGKSTAAMAVLGLLGDGARIDSGSVLFKGADLYALAEEERRRLRGDKISIVFQDPFTSLNPSVLVGRQIAEPLLLHKGLSERQAQAEVERLLAEVGIPHPRKMALSYPHQLSGGMKQRALIATALACDPELLILDEPTTALDVTIEAQILDLLEAMRRNRSLAIMFISHNLGVVSRLCDDVCVLYAGDVVEYGPTRTVLSSPRHPYTKGLLASLPELARRRTRLSPIPGRLPDLSDPPPGCVFEPRCPFAAEPCRREPQTLVAQGARHASRCWRSLELAGQPWRAEEREHAAPGRPAASGGALVEAREIRRVFRVGGLLGGLSFDMKGGGFPLKYEPLTVTAVDKVSLTIAPGETVGLVGESGCGKSTLGRSLINLIEPTSGVVRIDGEDLLSATPRRRRHLLRIAQIIFQNPDSSLNPRKTAREIIGRPVRLFGLAEGAALDRRVDELLDMVRLGKRYADRYPHQMSGGEKQRIGIARALATEPKFIVCDEAVSALDVSVQASVLNLLADLRDELGIAYLFISHDLSVIAHIADRVCVMYRGAIVEEGPTERVLAPPYHPYTEALLSAAPVVGDHGRDGRRVRLAGDVAELPREVVGCRFHHRCPRKLGAICETTAPPDRATGDGHRVACHIPLAELASVEPVVQLAEAAPLDAM